MARTACVGGGMIKKLEKYFSKKCSRNCPFYSYDGLNKSECLFDRCFQTDRFYNELYSGCRLPLFVLKIIGWILWKIEKHHWKTHRQELAE